jgi:hypothetical protein
LQKLATLAPDQHQAIWGSQSFYRALSLVNGGRKVEDDLFAGLPAMKPVRHVLGLATMRQPRATLWPAPLTP